MRTSPTQRYGAWWGPGPPRRRAVATFHADLAEDSPRLRSRAGVLDRPEPGRDASLAAREATREATMAARLDPRARPPSVRLTTQLVHLADRSARPDAPYAADSSRRSRGRGERGVEVEDRSAVALGDPVGVVDGVEVALAEVRGEGDRGAAGSCARPARPAPPPPCRSSRRRRTRGAPAGGRLRRVSTSSTRTTSSTKDSSSIRRPDAGAHARDSRRPGGRRRSPSRRCRRRPPHRAPCRAGSGRSPSACRSCRRRRTARRGRGTDAGSRRRAA